MCKMLTRLFAMIACACVATQALSADAIQYYECRADNDATASVFALDDTTRKVCDRTAQDTWIKPTAYGPEKVEWGDSVSTKLIYRKGKHNDYEHDTLVFVHIGRCSKLRLPPAQTCKN
jgi:hypothetical protein